MASVQLARDSQLGRPVAIKLLAENLASDETFRRRFLREAQVAAGLTHPNIVQVYDGGEEDGRPYIVMEYVEGETLGARLARGRLSPAEAVEVGLQVCAGLEHAHAAGLVHRDVKPQNLLLRRDGTAKIADFGIARAAEGTRLTQIGTVLGTAAYLAPEQAAGEDVTAAADLYSLGAVLYESLAGRPPYTAGSLPELAARQREAAVAPLRELAPGVPAALEEAVLRCLARDPADRPASAAELARSLAAAVAEAPTEPLPGAGETRATEVTRRRSPTDATALAPRRRLRLRGKNRRLALAALVSAAVAALALGLVLSSGGGRKLPATPANVAPVPPSSDPAQQARNLAAWLRAHSR